MKTPKVNPDNELLLKVLTVASDMLKLEKVFTPCSYNSSLVEWSQSHLEDVGQRIALNLGCEFKDNALRVQTEAGFYYNINLASEGNAGKLLKCLKQELSKTYKDPEVKGTLSRPYELDKRNWNDLAESFDNADQILECSDYIMACENLEQAQLHLERFKTTEPDNKKAIAKLTNMVAQWNEHVIAWQAIYKIGTMTDYKRLVEVKKERAINTLANENESIKALIEGYDDTLLRNTSSRKIYDLFKMFGIEPVNNINLYISLQAAETIKTTMASDALIWNEAHDQVIGSEPGGLKYKDFDAYLLHLQAALKDKTSKFNSAYLKKDGSSKTMSHRQRQRMYADSQNLKSDTSLIEVISKNAKTIKKYTA